MYLVYGWDRGTDDTVILYETDTKFLAIDWAKKYSSKENMGGWDWIYVSDRQQVDITWDGDPVIEETVLWSCWNEPMSWSDMEQPVKGNVMEEF